MLFPSRRDFLPVQIIYAGKTARCHPKFKFSVDWHITHSPKHWSNEETTVQYINSIILPYVAQVRDTLEDKENDALIIMDNFRGQITPAIKTFNIHVCLIPPNTTDLLQPLDISVNKPAKECLRKFEQWYSERVLEQVQGQDIDNVEIDPINLSLPVMKELGAKWIGETAEYISETHSLSLMGLYKL